ncbi:hypothetical protein HanRHA438_Chr11g0503371 [Helianthus annuus]|nr:hypothetical protein HanRHA438_Chr11g0503371 [Helianthus annuus]
MASWTHHEELALVTNVVDAMKGRPPGQTKYWPEAFAAYRLNVGNDRHNMNACQHKWRELRPKLDRFKAYYEAVPGGELSHEDRVAVANIEFRGKEKKAFDKMDLFEIYLTL